MNLQARVKIYEEEIQGLKAELNTYQKRCEQYAQAYDNLQHQFKELLRHRFGKKSERFVDDEQMSLFDTTASALIPEEQKNEIEVPAHRQKAKSKGKDLPRHIEIIPVSEEDKQCACGCIKTVIRYETKEIVHFQPAEFCIIEQKREVVACSNGCDGAMKTAVASKHILPKVKASEEFLSFLIVSKMDDRQPLYHLEKQLNEHHGVDCSRQTMARWLIELTSPLQPIFNLFKDEVINYDVASCDATTLQVLREPNRKAETKSYVYCIRGGPPGKEVVLYDYNDKLHKQFVKDWFEGYQGYLHVDGDNFFELVGICSGINLVNCNAHSRRKFEPIAQSANKKGLAKEALLFFKALYKVEREAKEKQLTPEQRYRLRQEKSTPILVEFKKWLDEKWPTVLPKSPLGNAIQYSLKLWPGLTRFMEDGRLEIDNNLTEQQIKPFVIARKNFLFATSVEGANALCMHFSLIRTAKLHGLVPYHYYVKLLKNIPYCQTAEDYERLLPWNMKQLDELKIRN